MSPADPAPVEAPHPKLRADAQRNRQLILDAARRAFAEHGLGVRLDEIAAIAGVGVGTVYRRFEDKDALVSALFKEEISMIVAIADEALASVDRGAALRWFFERSVAAMARDRGLQQILTGPHDSAGALSAHARGLLEPRVGELLLRAQAAGRLRPDIGPGDMPIIQILLSTIIDMTAEVRPELHHRYVQLVLAGLEVTDAESPLPGPAPTSDEGTEVMQRWRPRTRRPGARG